MARKKIISVYATDEEMTAISEYMHNKYPFIYRDNTLYSAERLCGLWRVKVREDCIEEVQSLLQPCEIKGFEL